MAADTNAGKFAPIRKSQVFVDKTNFISLFLHFQKRAIYITAPPKFGKSVNLDMLKTYLDAPVTDPSVNETARRFEEVFYPSRIPHEDNLFVGTSFHRNPQFPIHYRKYKVLDVDFSPLSAVENLETFNSILAEVVCQMHENHGTHLNFTYIDGKNKSRQACLDYHKKNLSLTLDAGKSLIASLNIHSKLGKRIIVLIDNFDALLHSFMTRSVEDKDTIQESLGRFLRGMVQDSSPAVKKSLMVGSLTLGGVFSTLTNDSLSKHIIAHRDGTVAQYFGFTDEEVDILLDQKGLRGRTNRLREAYRGYTVLDTPELILYNPASVIDYVELKRVNITDVFEDLTAFEPLFSNAQIGREIERILFVVPTTEPSKFVFSNGRLRVDMIDRLRRAFRTRYVSFASVDDVNLIMQYLFEMGFLTWKTGRSEMSDGDTVVTIEDVTLSCATPEARKLLKKRLIEGSYYEVALAMPQKKQSAFGEFMLDLPGKEVFHDLAAALDKIFRHVWTEIGWPVSMTGAFESIFAHNKTMAAQYRIKLFGLVVEKESDGFQCWNELDGFFVTERGVGIIVVTKFEAEHKAASNSFYSKLDRGCEDVYEVVVPKVVVNTKIVMLINLANTHHCQIFYRVSEPNKSDWVEGFAQHPAGELVEWEQVRKPGDAGMRSQFDLKAQQILHEQRLKNGTNDAPLHQWVNGSTGQSG